MKGNVLPLNNVSIRQIYLEGQPLITYQVPIYQRNYAWEETEINALIKDVLDFYEKDKNSVYYIGTLVTYKRGDNLFEIIDGQQRLTTIYLILKALDVEITNKLSYSARQISKLTIEKLPELPELYDEGIKNGFDYTKAAINNIVGEKKEEFKKYFLDKVRIIHYQVPKDVDLNHYFEVMNSRGEQLEKHEIIKARLCKDMNANEMTVFSTIWEACSYMNCYIQQKYQNENLFGKKYDDILNYDIFIERSETKKTITVR